MGAPTDVRRRFIQGTARIAAFWGFPKAMGAAYGVVYLSPDPVTLDQLVEIVGVTKGALSVHMAHLERLGLVRRDNVPGDRKDYFTADSDFWDVVRRILRERQQREFDRALRTVDDCLEQIEAAEPGAADRAELAFYRQRMAAMQRFFRSVDRVVAAVLAIDDFREATVGRLLRAPGARRQRARRAR